MATQFLPVVLENVERGDFLMEIDKAFAKLQRDFIKHVEEYKVSGKAGLNIGIEIQFSKTSQRSDALAGNFGIVTKIRSILPNKPSGVTTAFVAEDTEGKRTLFTQSAGTSKGNPRQGLIQEPSGESVV